MFPTRSPWFALIANFFLAWALFALFMKMGWINIASDLPLWQIVLFTGLINIVTMLIVRVIELLALPLIVIFAALRGSLPDGYDHRIFYLDHNLVAGVDPWYCFWPLAFFPSQQ
ncbi:MAG: hypothetical protein UW99_C0034G0002 [Candidatus Collierbacteria bacterium GW2011_GWC2_45_15]|uniref:Uncharacterized protein n=1 Tax=Candidatus Collierbacteria bacterium GW2011_GWC2_45_15 TaxID=1618394 RepID=A0A0G1PM06_9BACT|nr:MAG: hypothetical protein UW99_C0034G0002 [Candidatus Collierbacteria bacterium GW2011_GWC2_45_15]